MTSASLLLNFHFFPFNKMEYLQSITLIHFYIRFFHLLVKIIPLKMKVHYAFFYIVLYFIFK